MALAKQIKDVQQSVDRLKRAERNLDIVYVLDGLLEICQTLAKEIKSAKAKK